MSSAHLAVPLFGLGCGAGGTLQLEAVLMHEPGVLCAYVNPATEQVYVTYDPAVVGPQGIMEAIRRAGFRASEPVAR